MINGISINMNTDFRFSPASGRVNGIVIRSYYKEQTYTQTHTILYMFTYSVRESSCELMRVLLTRYSLPNYLFSLLLFL